MALGDPHIAAAAIVEDAGGELVGRTRLQKIGYLLELAGLGAGFDFEYRHYGPYSEDLATGIGIAAAFGTVEEVERRADWGGVYSIFSTSRRTSPASPRTEFIRHAKAIDAIELELAATAAYLYAAEGVGKTNALDPWEETRRRKPQKAANGRIEKAEQAYKNLKDAVDTPIALPNLSSFVSRSV